MCPGVRYDLLPMCRVAQKLLCLGTDKRTWRFRPLSPAQDSAQDTSLDRLREQVGLVSEQQCQELSPSFEPRFLVGLRVELHCRADVFVTQNTLHRLRITLQLSEEARECRTL